ncbi:hypothetical protein SMICM17S_11945 [Streptomyces microflavus]
MTLVHFSTDQIRPGGQLLLRPGVDTGVKVITFGVHEITV